MLYCSRAVGLNEYMQSETRNCQNCKNQFTIEPEDFDFYKKMDVPAPTFCPDCRFKQRAVWRNEMMLYSRTCNLCDKSTLSMYHPKSPYVIYCQDCWMSDKWDPFSYGQNYNFNKPFFEQFNELLRAVPKFGIYASNEMGPNINSEYTNFAGGSKDCYLVFNSSPQNENCAYGRGLSYCRDVFDSYFLSKTERAYEAINVHESSTVSWAQDVTGCINSFYLLNCSGCQNCFGCVNLRQKTYYFLNQPLTKKEYEKRVNEIRGSYQRMEEFKMRFEKLAISLPRRENANLKNLNSTGNYIFESKNCFNSFEIESCENSQYLFAVKFAKDSYDLIGHGRMSELLLEGVAVGTSQRVLGSWWVMGSHDVEYSFALRSGENCIGCDGVHNAKFAVLNKQYPEEEYKKIRAHIVTELKEKGLYGMYFPKELALFAYNETIAQDNFPLTKEVAITQGFRWQNELQKTSGRETLKSDKIPDHIKDVPDTITKEILSCITCGRNYKIILAELQLYRNMLLPIPRQCFYCRHQDRIRRRGPMKIFDRVCTNCKKEIKTTYSPDRPEIVYCEACYQQEVV